MYKRAEHKLKSRSPGDAGVISSVTWLPCSGEDQARRRAASSHVHHILARRYHPSADRSLDCATDAPHRLGDGRSYRSMLAPKTQSKSLLNALNNRSAPAALRWLVSEKNIVFPLLGRHCSELQNRLMGSSSRTVGWRAATRSSAATVRLRLSSTADLGKTHASTPVRMLRMTQYGASHGNSGRGAITSIL